MPANYTAWDEWREAYAEHVSAYNVSQKSASDDLYLRIQLGRLGFVGVSLDLEMTYIKEGGT